MSAAPGELLIFGCGFLGLRVAKQWIAAGGTVRAITRPPAGSPLPPERSRYPPAQRLTNLPSCGPSASLQSWPT